MYDLEQFIKSQLLRPFEWGKTDCASVIDEWVYLNRGYSILERAKFDYSSFDEKQKIIDNHKNYLKAMLYVVKKNKEKSTRKPVAGDFAAIIIANQYLGAAIHCGTFWFTRNERGVIGQRIEDTKVIKAWKLFNNA